MVGVAFSNKLTLVKVLPYVLFVFFEPAIVKLIHPWQTIDEFIEVEKEMEIPKDAWVNFVLWSDRKSVV